MKKLIAMVTCIIIGSSLISCESSSESNTESKNSSKILTETSSLKPETSQPKEEPQETYDYVSYSLYDLMIRYYSQAQMIGDYIEVKAWVTSIVNQSMDYSGNDVYYFSIGTDDGNHYYVHTDNTQLNVKRDNTELDMSIQCNFYDEALLNIAKNKSVGDPVIIRGKVANVGKIRVIDGWDMIWEGSLTIEAYEIS